MFFTCLKDLLRAEEGILAGDIWSKMPPLVLNRGIASIKTITETSPKHRTSAFSTLYIDNKQNIRHRYVNRCGGFEYKDLQTQKEQKYKLYPSDRSHDAKIRPALR